jgi:hypothetical protein
MPGRTKLVIEAKNFSLLPEAEFFNTIGQNQTLKLPGSSGADSKKQSLG